MTWFGKRQEAGAAPPAAPEIAAIRAEVERLDAALRTLRSEWAEMHDRLYRFMKRAEVSARKVEAAAAAAEPPEPLAIVTPETPLNLSRRALWGARGRRAQRLARAAPAAAEPIEGE